MKLFKIKEFAGGSLAQTLNAIAWSGILIMASFYLQVVVGDICAADGLDLLAIDATFILRHRSPDDYPTSTDPGRLLWWVSALRVLLSSCLHLCL